MSNEVFLKRAEKVFIGGVNSPVRSFKRVGGNPIVIKSAKGPYLQDVEGNQFIDLVMSYGPHLFGHLYEPIHHKLQEALSAGLCFGMTSEREILWGEKIISFLPQGWKVRAMCSGTEACMTAIRLARGHTKKNIIVKCSGHYHGHVDSLLFDAGSGLATLQKVENSVADSEGLPEELSKLLISVPFNCPKTLEEVFIKWGPQIAAFILEPVMGNMGVVLPQKEFLLKARELTQKHKSLLIFDEVMTGFRVSKKSSYGRFDIVPDLICFGKIVGGGLPLSALAGSEAVLSTLAPQGGVYQAGTLSGNPVATSAGLAMLEEIEKEDPYSDLESLGLELESLIIQECRTKGIAVSVLRCGSMMSAHFTDKAPQNAGDVKEINHEVFKKYFWNMVKNKIMLPPSPYEAYFLSTAHIPIKEALFEGTRKSLKDI